MNIEKWINEKSVEVEWPQEYFNYDLEVAIRASDLRELLKTHAIVPRVASDEFCRGVDRQSCQYTSDAHVRTMLRFIINEAEKE